MIKITYIFILLYFISCSYIPISKHKNGIIKDRIYTEIDISIAEPQNSIILKDILNNTLFRYFNNIISIKNKKYNFMKVSYKSVKFKPLSYNENGYTIAYKAEITLNFQSSINNKKIEKDIIGNYHFFIDSSELLSTDIKFKVIEYASENALNKFINFYLLPNY